MSILMQLFNELYVVQRTHCTWCIVQHFSMHSTILRCSHISFHYIRFPFLLLCFFCFRFIDFFSFTVYVRMLGAIACRCTESQTHSHVSRIWKSPSRSYTINCTRHWKLCYTFTAPNTTTQQHNINAWKWKCVWIVVHTHGAVVARGDSNLSSMNSSSSFKSITNDLWSMQQSFRSYNIDSFDENRLQPLMPDIRIWTGWAVGRHARRTRLRPTSTK